MRITAVPSTKTAVQVMLGHPFASAADPLYAIVGVSVAVCLFDTQTTWCGVRQIILPHNHPAERQDAMLHADAAMEDFYCHLCGKANINQGAITPHRLVAKIFGGAQIDSETSLGTQSASFARSWLRMRRIRVTAESLGGNYQRELILVPDPGTVFCRKQRVDTAFLAEERVSLAAGSQSANRIELF